MPAYNAEATIGESVASALGQTMGDLELVVVDDGSQVPVTEVLSDIRDPRLRIVTQPRNAGVAAARNAALAQVRTPLLSQLDADDSWEPDYLEAVLPALEDPAVGLVYANARTVGQPGGDGFYQAGLLGRHPIDRFPELARINPVPALTVTMRAPAVRAAGGYPSWLSIGEDYWVYLKLAAAGWRFAHVDRVLAHYRSPEGNTQNLTSNLARNDRDMAHLMLRFSLRHPLVPGPRAAAARAGARFVGRSLPGQREARRAVRRLAGRD